MTCSPKEIKFHNQPLVTFEQDNIHYTAIKPICENIGLDWTAQHSRIKRDEVLGSTMVVITMVAEDGKNRDMTCLPIDYLNGWLFGVSVKRVKPEIRDALIMYKKECYQALHDYWVNGKAERTTIDERAGLQDAVEKLARKKKGLNYPDAYSMIHQYMNVKHIDEIPKEDIQTAVAYCHKVILEGDLVEPELISPNEPVILSYPKQTSCMRYLSFREMHSCGWHLKINQLLGNLKRGSNNTVFMAKDLSGIEHEVNSLLHLIEMQRYKLDEIHRISQC